MPKKTDQNNIPQNISEQNNAPIELMDIEQENENEQPTAEQMDDLIPDLTDIENEEITDPSGFKYIPERFWKCFILKKDLAKTLTSITLKFLLCKNKYPELKTKHHRVKEVYVINRSWYEKWKKYSRYPTFKRIIRTYENYERKPINFNPDEKSSPGIINNTDLLIRNKTSDESRNILVSKNNNCLDTKLLYKKDFKLLSKVRFDLLNNYFKTDIILKGKKVTDNNNSNYDIFSVHFRIVFLPTLACFKNVNEENIENFKKSQNIIYDVYFKQNDSEKDIKKELTSILKEKPQILTNMGIELIMDNTNDDIISSYINSFDFYMPNENNDKSAKEITDYIISNEIIEKLKKDEKISEDEIKLKKNFYLFNIDNMFHLNWINSKNNMDEVLKGTIFIEYLPFADNESKAVASIFDIISKSIVVQSSSTFYAESCAYRTDNGQAGPACNGAYNLDNFTIDKEKNKNGLVGLNNLGNTCYMNTGLQCLSNCELLTKYFLDDYYKEFINKDNPIGSKGEIVEKYSQLIHHLWQGNNECVSPIQFKHAFGRMYNAFNNNAQQDSQEFISYLLDVLHEDLNKVMTKPYIETKDFPEELPEEEQFKIQKDLYLCRNQSLIADLIYGFYKSTLYCPDPNCKNIRKSFEPFNMITLSLVNEAKLRKLEAYQDEQNKILGIKIITINFIPFKINYKPLRFEIRIKKGMEVSSFKKKIEAITGFNENTFEIYKLQEKEFIYINPDIVLLEDFLKDDNKLFLFQIPPYVFNKPSDYFDKEYEELNSDFDKLYLKEEKYEGNDLYEKYNEKKKIKKKKNKKNKKFKTDDDIEKKIKSNALNVIRDEDEKETGEEKEGEEKEEDDDDDDNDNHNDINDNGKKEKEKEKEDEDIEMKDNDLFIDRNKWIRAEFYNYTYKIDNNQNKPNEEQRINNSRIVYINKEWDNTQLYICILEMLEGVRNDLPEIKAAWFQNLYEVTQNIKEMQSNKEKKEILDYFEQELPTHPLMLEYLGYFNFNTQNIQEKTKNWKDSVVIFDSREFFLEKTINKIGIKNQISDVVLMFKIIWKSAFSTDYNEGSLPIEFVKSEKLDGIIKNQREEEFMQKNNVKIKKGNNVKTKKNNHLKLEDLLTNFNEIEKLTNDNQWYCPKCKQFQLADKKMEIYSINEVVILHLKRFRNNQKNDTLVEFPLEGLNLGEYLPKKDEKNIFDLFAVANHSGGLHGGHYYAYCKNFNDGEWYEFNDSHVSKINKNSVVRSTAYVLFYSRRREEKLNEEELYKKPFIQIDISKYQN